LQIQQKFFQKYSQQIRVIEASRKFEIKFDVLNVPPGFNQIGARIAESLNKDRA